MHHALLAVRLSTALPVGALPDETDVLRCAGRGAGPHPGGRGGVPEEEGRRPGQGAAAQGEGDEEAAGQQGQEGGLLAVACEGGAGQEGRLHKEKEMKNLQANKDKQMGGAGWGWENEIAHGMRWLRRLL